MSRFEVKLYISDFFHLTKTKKKKEKKKKTQENNSRVTCTIDKLVFLTHLMNSSFALPVVFRGTDIVIIRIANLLCMTLLQDKMETARITK